MSSQRCRWHSPTFITFDTSKIPSLPALREHQPRWTGCRGSASLREALSRSFLMENRVLSSPSAHSEADLVSGRHWAPTQPWLPSFQAPSQLPSVEFLTPWLPMAPSTLPSTRLHSPREETGYLGSSPWGHFYSFSSRGKGADLPFLSIQQLESWAPAAKVSEGMVRGLRGTCLTWWRGRPRKIDGASGNFGPPSGSERSEPSGAWEGSSGTGTTSR